MAGCTDFSVDLESTAETEDTLEGATSARVNILTRRGHKSCSIWRAPTGTELDADCRADCQRSVVANPSKRDIPSTAPHANSGITHPSSAGVMASTLRP